MDAIECIRTRRSIRRFKSEPVPKEILKEIIETAKWSPSYKNTQPWEIVVLSGAKKDSLSGILVGLYKNNVKPCPDIREPESWPPEVELRIASLFKKRSETFGIDFNDPEIIKKAKIANFNFYRAPHAIYFFQDSSLTPWSIFDLGLFAQSFMLAAHARGVGTVPQAFATDYARDVKNFLGIPEAKRLVIGMSAGYPDLEADTNKFKTDRADIDEIAGWIE